MAERAWTAATVNVAVRRLEPQPILALRLRYPDAPNLAAVGSALGMALPSRPNTTTAVGAARAIWTGPAEWKILCDAQTAARVAAAGIRGTWHVADLTHGLAGFAVSGVCAGDLLAKGCTLDLHPRAFAADACAQTILAQAPILLARTADMAGFQLFVDVSYARHLQCWFADAVVEFA